MQLNADVQGVFSTLDLSSQRSAIVLAQNKLTSLYLCTRFLTAMIVNYGLSIVLAVNISFCILVVMLWTYLH